MAVVNHTLTRGLTVSRNAFVLGKVPFGSTEWTDGTRLEPALDAVPRAKRSREV